MADRYTIHYAQEALNDIDELRVFDQRKIVEAIDQFLIRRPTKVSKGRIKMMVQPFDSQFRLRVDDFRVYYDVEESSRMVHILRVLFKGTAQTSETLK